MFFYYRRLLVPLSVILFPTILILQYATLVMSGIFTIIVIGYNKPFKSSSRNKVEMFEEAGIIVIMYHIICFTDWVPDLEVRHNLGYSLIGCMGL